MVRGHPDFQTYAGRSVGGALVNTVSFEGDIGAEGIGTIDLGAVSEKNRHAFLQITVSSDDDEHIHGVTLTRRSDGWDFFIGRFIMDGHFSIDSDDLVAGDEARLTIINNSSEEVTFEGVVSWVVKEI